jgi:hypothetical protein
MTVRLSVLRALELISVRGRVDTKTIVRLVGLGESESLVTSLGIEPATFRLVAYVSTQHFTA